jgi:hypothetical protein
MYIYEKNADRRNWGDLGQGSREKTGPALRRERPLLYLVRNGGVRPSSPRSGPAASSGR